jgi:mannose-6-phosphate isomerase-like protein (cupin superfamily)
MANSHTQIRLTDVKDSAAEFGMADTHEARFAQSALDAEQTGISHHRLKPGKRQPFGHHHDKAEEVYVVLNGNGRIKLDDEIIEVQPLDAVRIAPQVTRAVEAGRGGIEYIVFGPHHEGDGELIQGWWSD